MDEPLWPLAVYFVAVLSLVAAIIAVSYLLGQRHREPATGQAYESGIPPTGSARLRFPIDYYLVAMFFVIFDVESIFLFAWAIAWRELGWAGYIEVLVFIGILLAALLYLWRVGALDWGTVRYLKLRRTGRMHGVAQTKFNESLLPRAGDRARF
jgi:NADH-quinone oxidoreductase subunit A